MNKHLVLKLFCFFELIVGCTKSGNPSKQDDTFDGELLRFSVAERMREYVDRIRSETTNPN